MKLTPLEDTISLQEIDNLHQLKPITNKPLISSQMDLILLSTNLLLKSSLLIRGEIQSTKTAKECTNEAIELFKIINSNDVLTVDAVAKVRREFKISI